MRTQESGTDLTMMLESEERKEGETPRQTLSRMRKEHPLAQERVFYHLGIHVMPVHTPVATIRRHPEAYTEISRVIHHFGLGGELGRQDLKFLAGAYVDGWRVALARRRFRAESTLDPLIERMMADPAYQEGRLVIEALAPLPEDVDPLRFVDVQERLGKENADLRTIAKIYLRTEPEAFAETDSIVTAIGPPTIPLLDYAVRLQGKEGRLAAALGTYRELPIGLEAFVLATEALPPFADGRLDIATHLAANPGPGALAGLALDRSPKRRAARKRGLVGRQERALWKRYDRLLARERQKRRPNHWDLLRMFSQYDARTVPGISLRRFVQEKKAAWAQHRRENDRSYTIGERRKSRQLTRFFSMGREALRRVYAEEELRQARAEIREYQESLQTRRRPARTALATAYRMLRHGATLDKVVDKLKEIPHHYNGIRKMVYTFGLGETLTRNHLSLLIAARMKGMDVEKARRGLPQTDAELDACMERIRRNRAYEEGWLVPTKMKQEPAGFDPLGLVDVRERLRRGGDLAGILRQYEATQPERFAETNALVTGLLRRETTDIATALDFALRLQGAYGHQRRLAGAPSGTDAEEEAMRSWARTHALCHTGRLDIPLLAKMLISKGALRSYLSRHTPKTGKTKPRRTVRRPRSVGTASRARSMTSRLARDEYVAFVWPMLMPSRFPPERREACRTAFATCRVLGESMDEEFSGLPFEQIIENYGMASGLSAVDSFLESDGADPVLNVMEELEREAGRLNVSRASLISTLDADGSDPLYYLFATRARRVARFLRSYKGDLTKVTAKAGLDSARLKKDLYFPSQDPDFFRQIYYLRAPLRGLERFKGVLLGLAPEMPLRLPVKAGGSLSQERLTLPAAQLEAFFTGFYNHPDGNCPLSLFAAARAADMTPGMGQAVLERLRTPYESVRNLKRYATRAG